MPSDETLDPDVTRRDDGAYWAAAAVLADQAGDHRRTDEARQQLDRLGYRIDVSDARRRQTFETRKGAGRA